jgi:hypothetical protein
MNDRKKLGGQPYGNLTRVYRGTGSIKGDIRLNLQVDRFVADRQAFKNVERYYQSAGNIDRPLVIMHTTLDPVAPFWNYTLYQAKVMNRGKSSWLTSIPIERYGHATFTPSEIINAFSIVIKKGKEQTAPLTH